MAEGRFYEVHHALSDAVRCAWSPREAAASAWRCAAVDGFCTVRCYAWGDDELPVQMGEPVFAIEARINQLDWLHSDPGLGGGERLPLRRAA